MSQVGLLAAELKTALACGCFSDGGGQVEALGVSEKQNRAGEQLGRGGCSLRQTPFWALRGDWHLWCNENMDLILFPVSQSHWKLWSFVF